VRKGKFPNGIGLMSINKMRKNDANPRRMEMTDARANQLELLEGPGGQVI
jgi:hypothetical protein